MTAPGWAGPRPLPEHGTDARYQRGCRCQPCRAARAAYMRDYRQRTDRYEQRVTARARDLAARWVREHQPAVWERCKNEAEDHVQAAAGATAMTKGFR